jgi:alpha-methylacyl-CoA racemase
MWEVAAGLERTGTMTDRVGVLAGLRIIEMAGIGPGPFCAMMLADHGAEVIRVERPGTVPDKRDPLLRSRRSIALDLKDSRSIYALIALAGMSDGLIEGFRPGVMERLGLGPDVLLSANPKLVYGRMTGWGQTGPYAAAAGHDINYLALSGMLHAIGRKEGNPVPPLNLVGDFGGGGMMLAFGMVAALLHVQRGGAGQVIDCAMTEGAATLGSMIYGFRATHGWRDERGANALDGGAHYYDTYECADGEHVAVGAIEPQFYALLRQATGTADDPAFDAQHDAGQWAPLKARLGEIFRKKTRQEWCAIMEYGDACFAPVLAMAEAPEHPHSVARDAFVTLEGVVQPAPAPRFLGTPAPRPRAHDSRAADTDAVLAEFGIASSAVRQSST